MKNDYFSSKGLIALVAGAKLSSWVKGLVVGTSLFINACGGGGGGGVPRQPIALPKPLVQVSKPAMSVTERDNLVAAFNTGLSTIYNQPLAKDANKQVIFTGNSLAGGSGGIEDEVRALFQKVTNQGVGPVNFGSLDAGNYTLAINHNIIEQGMGASRDLLYLHIPGVAGPESIAFRGFMGRSDDIYLSVPDHSSKANAIHSYLQLLIGKETGSKLTEGLSDNLDIPLQHLPGAANSYIAGNAINAGSPITGPRKSLTQLALLVPPNVNPNAINLIVERARRMAGAHAAYTAANQGKGTTNFPISLPFNVRTDEDAADHLFAYARVLNGFNPANTFAFLSGGPDSILATIDTPAGGSALEQVKANTFNVAYNADGTVHTPTAGELALLVGTCDCWPYNN